MRHRILLLAALAAQLAASPGLAKTDDGRLGAACDDAAPCDRDLFCLTPEYGNPGGLCSAPCDRDADCEGFADGARCTGPGGMCLEGCAVSETFGDSLDPDKCHGRSDVACTVLQCGGDRCEICTSFCTLDAQCGPGLECNLPTRKCAPPPSPTGLPTGSACKINDVRNECSGVCEIDFGPSLNMPEQQGICVDPCVIGAPGTCAPLPDGGGPRACLGRFVAVDQGHGTGDVGYCLALCNCSSDCTEHEVCDPIDLGGRYDSLGVCVRTSEPVRGPDCLTTGADAGAGCASGDVRACTTSEGCVGTSTCLPGGGYSECACLEQPEGGASAPGDRSKRAAGSGCGASRPGNTSFASGNALVVALLALVRLAARRRRLAVTPTSSARPRAADRRSTP